MGKIIECEFCEKPFTRSVGQRGNCSLTCRFYVKTRYNSFTGCLEWVGASARYRGQIALNGKVELASRVRWMMTNGPIPYDLCVCHWCNNPGCVLLAHLYLDTHAGNIAYREKCGRNRPPRGEKHVLATVPDADVVEIIEAYASGLFTQKELADQVGVTQACVSRWVCGQARVD